MAPALREPLWGPMLYLFIKAAISGLIIAIASEIARRSPGIGGLIVSLPLVSVLATIWLWHDSGDTTKVAALLQGAFVYFLPSMPLFLIIPLLLKRGFGFWPSLLVGCVITIMLYALTTAILARYELRL